jgi:hypothetical protein
MKNRTWKMCCTCIQNAQNSLAWPPLLVTVWKGRALGKSLHLKVQLRWMHFVTGLYSSLQHCKPKHYCYHTQRVQSPAMTQIQLLLCQTC